MQKTHAMTTRSHLALTAFVGIALIGGLWAWKRARGGPAVAPCGVTSSLSAGGGTWPNEPAGLTVLNDYDFSDSLSSQADGTPIGSTGWRVWRNGAIGGGGARVVDGTAPLSAPYAFEFSYPIGFPSGRDPAMLECVFPPEGGARELYWGFWWKPSSPFQSDGSGVNKIAFIWTPTVTGGGSTDLLYFDLSPDPWRIRAMNDLIGGGGPSAGRRLEPNVDTTVVSLAQWHRIEIYAKYSSGSAADGVLKWWVDGRLNGQYTDLKMVQDGGFDHVQFAPTYGGNTGDVKRQNDYYRIDHVRLSRGQ